MANPNERSRRKPMKMVQNFRLLWLNENNDDFNNSITQLQQVNNLINTFDDVDECIDFVTDMTEDIVFMIVSETLCRSVMPILDNICHIKSVYIFSNNHTQLQNFNNEWSKIKGVYMDITSICADLQMVSETWDRNKISINLMKQTDRIFDEKLNTLECSFMYTQILKEILLTIDFTQEHIDQFSTYYKEQYLKNTTTFRDIETFETEYYNKSPIYWYTCYTFLYDILNRALRLMDISLIVKLGFFLRDLHQNIVKLHIEQFGEQSHLKPFTVYRGQGLSQADFEQLKNTPGCLLSFNNFLSTSYDRLVSDTYAISNADNPDHIGVLFQISVDPSIAKTSYANITNESNFQQEKEILFSMHSVFRVGQVKQVDGNTRLWEIDLMLTSDTDPQLCHLTKRIHEETSIGAKGWFRLGQLLIKLAQFDKAEELYNNLLEQTTDQDEKSFLLHQLGIINCDQTNYKKALDYYKKAFDIREKKLRASHPDRATWYNNIGSAYAYMNDYSQALEYYEKACKTYEKSLPANYSNLATTYNNMGLAYKNMDEFSKALTYYERSLQIKLKTVPKNHPDVAASFNNIGNVYEDKCEYSTALEYHKKALEIFEKILPKNHSYLIISYNIVGSIYHKMEKYPRALEYYKKAIEIFEKILPKNHPYLAVSYQNVGTIYDDMEKYPKALEYHKKALQIFEKNFSENNPSWATFYNNIGKVYYKIEQYSRALEYFIKALENAKRTLPATHSDLAISYNNVGQVYMDMNEYEKALEYYEHALVIEQCSLPSTDPSIKVIKETIEFLKEKL